MNKYFISKVSGGWAVQLYDVSGNLYTDSIHNTQEEADLYARSMNLLDKSSDSHHNNYPDEWNFYEEDNNPNY